MKKILFALFLVVMFASVVSAQPYVVSDAAAGINSYKITGALWLPLTTVPAQANGSLKLSVATAPVGQTSMTVSACIVDPIWGEACSTSVPFVFIRPSAPSTPVNIKLSL